MNISTRNEFEVIPAFTTIAGGTAGGWTYREICVEILDALDRIVGFSETYNYWVDLERHEDYQVIECNFVDELMDYWNEHVDTMPDFCWLTFHDNEAIVLPDVDSMLEETYRVDSIPDTMTPIEDEHGRVQRTLAHVNDHGNVDYLYFDDNKREYVIAWSVV